MEKVVVLLSTYNGGRYLEEQLASLFAQDEVKIDILVRDDGSSDRTIAILEQYSKKGLLTWYTGKNKKPAKSFLDLLTMAPQADFYAFCDQDDIWEKDKLITAITAIKNRQEPALYCSNTTLVSHDLNVIRNSNYSVTGDFMESLVSNPVTGCTCVINKVLKDKIIQFTPDILDMHDWWIYRVCMAFDGFFYFDKIPHIKYRQHENNVIGGTFSKKKELIHHLKLLTSSKNGLRYEMTKMLYDGYFHELPEHNKILLTQFMEYKNNPIKKIKLLKTILKGRLKKKIRNKLIVAVILNKY